MFTQEMKKMPYGGDYNPEQWSEDIWEEDMRLFEKAGVDIVTLNVFNWATLQRDDDVYDFSSLDKIMNMVRDHGIKVCLATSTGAHPAWMARKYPDILRTEFNGMKRKFGGRHNSCPNSQTYRKYSTRLAQKIAERYKDYDNLVAWHISNEYGGVCYCDNCERAFRVWLKDKYKTIDRVNEVWNTKFWGHTFYDFDEIVVPNLLSEQFSYDRTMFQGISLDYMRFNSDSILSCYRLEYEAIKKVSDKKITTNLMGFYRELDYQKWARYMDFVSWDSYPSCYDDTYEIAMRHDLMRGIGGGKPFILMEQTPSVTNWQQYNSIKRPGEMRLISYQAVAHGSDSIMFFQMRRSIGACEKFHGALIDHVGNGETRVYRECCELGEELKNIGDATLDAVTESSVAILFDWDNWWAVEYSAGPSSDLKYIDEVKGYYKALYNKNVSVDIVSVEDDLSKYAVVIAPLLYMVKGSYNEVLEGYVRGGGTLITSFFSGIVDEHDLVTVGGYPGKLRKLLGIWVEEIDGLPPEKKNHFTYNNKQHDATLLCDVMHTEGARELAVYEEDYYSGMPVLTVNSYGDGEAYYMGTRADEEFYSEFIGDVLEKKGVKGVMDTPMGVEATSRTNEKGNFVFILNHNDKDEVVVLNDNYRDVIRGREFSKEENVVLSKKDVLILKRM